VGIELNTNCGLITRENIDALYRAGLTSMILSYQTPDAVSFRTKGDGVETLYEAFHRVFGDWAGEHGAFTASIHEPCTRGADHATLERRVIGDRDRLREITARYAGDTNPKWQADEQRGVHNESIVDTRGLAQAIASLRSASDGRMAAALASTASASNRRPARPLKRRARACARYESNRLWVARRRSISASSTPAPPSRSRP